MNFNFGEVLTRAWYIIWKHKVLWIFGILASCAGGRGGGSGGNGSSYQNGSGNNPFDSRQFDRFIEQAGQWLNDNWWIIMLAVLALILLSIALYALGMMGRIGLIHGTAQADKGAEQLTFAELWAGSMPYFWRIFGLNFLLGLALGLVVLIIMVPLFIFGFATMGIGLLCILPLLCVLIPISWVVTVVIEQAQAAIVLEDLPIMTGLQRGWEVVKSNVGSLIVMTLILGIGGGIIGVIIALPVILTVIPVVIGASTLRDSLTPLYIAAACCVAYFPVLLLLSGVLTAYTQSTWTLTYLRLTAPKLEAPVILEANA